MGKDTIPVLEHEPCWASRLKFLPFGHTDALKIVCLLLGRKKLQPPKQTRHTVTTACTNM